MEEIKKLLDLYQQLTIEVDSEANKEQETSNFVSFFKIDGCPIIPPLMTEEKRKEMAAYKEKAIKRQKSIEQRRKQKLIDKVQAIVDSLDDTSCKQNESPSSDATQSENKAAMISSPSTEGDKSTETKINHQSSTSIVTLSVSCSGHNSPTDVTAVDVKSSEAVEIPKEVAFSNRSRNSPTDVMPVDVKSSEAVEIPKEVASSNSSGTENSSLLQTVVPAVTTISEFDSITVLDEASNISDNLSSKQSVQDSLDIDQVRESVSDSETLRNYLGEYSRLPTPGPSSTPDVSIVSSEYATHNRLDIEKEKTINDDSGDSKVIGTVTGSSLSFGTLGQSCSLPVSLVTESTSTLYEIIEPWNMPQDLHGKKEKRFTENEDGKTPTPSHVRRNSYTLDHPSPALLEAQAQNRAPHVQEKQEDPAEMKPVRRALNLFDEVLTSAELHASTTQHTRSTSLVSKKDNPDREMISQERKPDSQFDSVDHSANMEVENVKKTMKDNHGVPLGNTMGLMSAQQNPIAVSTVCLEGTEDNPAINVIFLQQQMDMLEEMQKKMMEEQQKQLQVLMEEQKLQQEKVQEEMLLLEKRIRQKNLPENLAHDNYITNGTADGLQPHTDYRSLPVIMPLLGVMDQTPLTHESLNGGTNQRYPLSSSPDCTHTANWTTPNNDVDHKHTISWATPPDSRNKEQTTTWTTPTLQNMKVHNGKHLEKVSAVVKGYLARRLINTDKVQSIIRTIKDMWQFIWQFQTETPVKRGVLSSSDTVLANRVLSQLRAAQFELYDIFFGITTTERMTIIARQRVSEKLKQKKDQHHFISAATLKARERRQQIRPAEPKVFGRPQTAPPGNFTHSKSQNAKSSANNRSFGSSKIGNEKSSRNVSQSVKPTHGGVSKAKCNSPSRKGRKSTHPFARPLSAASRRSTRATTPK